MLSIVDYEPHHLPAVRLQEHQQYLSTLITLDLAAELAGPECESFTALKDGWPIACSGIVHRWPGVAMAWAYIGDSAGDNFVTIHRAVMRFLDAADIRRIEMTVDVDFIEAHRWARMLGFEMEAANMRAYTPQGGDCALYARVK